MNKQYFQGGWFKPAAPLDRMGVEQADPNDPAWQKTVYMRYKPNGRVSSMPMWQAQDYLNDKYWLWEEVTLEDFEAYESEVVQHDKEEAERLADVVARRISDYHSEVSHHDDERIAQLTEQVSKLTELVATMAQVQVPKQSTRKKKG